MQNVRKNGRDGKQEEKVRGERSPGAGEVLEVSLPGKQSRAGLLPTLLDPEAELGVCSPPGSAQRSASWPHPEENPAPSQA